jgi:hypothetical protein
MIFNIREAVACGPWHGFAIMPLPSKKALWEAKNEEQWRVEFQDAVYKREIYGVTMHGNLMKMQQRFGEIIKSNASWEEWLGSSDGLGTAVMVAASLLNGPTSQTSES